LQLLPGRLTPLLHERLVQVGTVARSFAAGAAVFFSFTRTPASEPTARRYTERAGAVVEACASEETPTVPEGAGDDPRPAWVGADGVMVRLVGGAWREVRTVSIGRVDPPRMVNGKERGTTTDLSYFSRLTDGADVFIDRAAAECCRRGIAALPVVGAGSDGADWCQDLFDRYCPQAARCLDFYHAGQRVHTFSKALWNDVPALAQWYAGEQLHALKHQGPGRLLATLACWSQAAVAGKLRKIASEQHAFFASRTALLDYPGIRACGLPIGTGNAESANLHVVQDRLKGPGKFWGREHVNPMLALRNAWCSDRWEEAWTAASKRLAEGHYPVRLVHVPQAKT
jgi:hypothetical protein